MASAKVSVAELRTLILTILKFQKYNPQEISSIMNVLLYAQLRGNNQGVVKLLGKGLPRNPAAASPRIVRQSAVSALVDGGQSIGMHVLSEATAIAARKAKAQGVSVVGVRNISSSTGAIGYYARNLAQQGLIGIVMAQSPELVAPHGSYEPIFGTNPIAVGVPSAAADGAPVVLDMATSAIAYFGLIEAAAAGSPIPGDVALDASGQPTTSAKAALEGAILPFDRSYKGAALALVVELLGGALVGAAVTDKLAAANWGDLVIAIDPSLFGDDAAFRRRVSAVVARVRGAQRLPGVTRVLTPGEAGDERAAAAVATGWLPMERNMLRQLRAQAAATAVKGGTLGAAADGTPRSRL